MKFIAQNAATIVVGLALLLAVGLIIRSLWRQKKQGKSCGCHCAGCPQAGICHPAQPKE